MNNEASEISTSPTKGKRPEIEDYDILNCLGWGAFGKVYKTIKKATNKEYALKVFFY